MWWNIVWVVIVVAWFAWEFWALRSDTDHRQPFTYWVRDLFNTKRGPYTLGWWLALAIIAWLAFHFLIEGVEL